MLTIQFKEGISLYEQIYLALVDEIRQGRLQPQDRLPSRRDLARHLGVSLTTVKRSYDQLLDEGYIVARERSGYYVDKLHADTLPPPAADNPPVPDPKPNLSSPLYNFCNASLDRTVFAQTDFIRAAKAGMLSLTAEKVTGLDRRIGLAPLRTMISSYLRDQRGVSCHPDFIVITGGYVENMRIVESLFPDQVFGLENPGYLLNSPGFSGSGRQVLPIPLDLYGFSVADLEKTPADIAVVTPNHQFPCGMIMGIRRSQRLLQWAQDRPNRYIVEDNYDSDFKYSGRPIPALKSLDHRDKVILSGSFSQALAHTLQVGYLVLPPLLLEKFLQGPSLHTEASPLDQWTLYHLMESGAFTRHLQRLNRYYKQKRDAILTASSGIPACQILGAEAGQHLVLRISSLVGRPDLVKTLETAWQEAGIGIENLSRYTLGPCPETDYILAYGALSAQDLDTGLPLLFGPIAELDG